MQVSIQPFRPEDRGEILAMMRVFYDSPAVITKSSDAVLERDFDDCVGDCPFVEGYIFRDEAAEGAPVAGYAMLAKSYSTELGGPCLWIEDLYLKEPYRHQGIGTAFFRFLDAKYGGKFIRFRLEAEPENQNAIVCYHKAGYEVLPYLQMEKRF